MNNKHYSTLLIIIVILVLSLSACQTNSAGDPPVNDPGDAGETAPTDAPPVIPTATLVPEPTPEPTPTPNIPAGWSEFAFPALGFGLYVPAGWEAIPYEDQKVDLREIDGEGWLEIRGINAENAHEWGIDYKPGDSSAALLDTMLLALREDGDFSVPYTVTTQEGLDVMVTQGTYYVFDEMLMVGVLGWAEHALIIQGHNAESAEDLEAEWARLAPIYEQVMWSIVMGLP